MARSCYGSRVDVRAYAERIVTSSSLADKLAPPPVLPGQIGQNPRDATRGGVNGPALPGHSPEGGYGKALLGIIDAALDPTAPPRRIAAPGRPAELAIVPGRRARVPPLAGMRDRDQRARILHALANHEL
jgi:hypothetical protein